MVVVVVVVVTERPGSDWWPATSQRRRDRDVSGAGGCSAMPAGGTAAADPALSALGRPYVPAMPRDVDAAHCARPSFPASGNTAKPMNAGTATPARIARRLPAVTVVHP